MPYLGSAVMQVASPAPTYASLLPPQISQAGGQKNRRDGDEISC